MAFAGFLHVRRRLALLAFALSLVGLGASLASLVDYLSPEPSFCADSGCATVRASAWAHPLGVPMPVAGVAYFAVMALLAVHARPRMRTALAITGGAWAVVLIAVQAFVVGAWCRLCMIADPVAIALAVTIVAGASTVELRPRRRLATLAVLGTLAFAAVPVTALTLGHEAPAATATAVTTTDVIARERRPGMATVVEFVDFECPFCRALAPRLDAAIADAGVPVRVVRKMTPLRIHPHALTAALAWCCADAQGKGDAMAAALFAAPADQLTPEGCEQLAVNAGCDRARYRDALADPRTRARVDLDSADARTAGVHGLPTLFIGDVAFGGANHTQAELGAAIARAVD